MKKKEKKFEDIFGVTSKIDTYYCMISCPKWVQLLIGNGKDYQTFLSGLISVNFFEGIDGRTTITRMSRELGIKTQLISKWIKEMYQDILDLNFDKPELFQAEGIFHELHFKGFRGRVTLKLWLKAIPRLYEKVELFFLDAKIGSRVFWVKDVHHEIEDGEHTVSIMLDGGILNKYRTELLDRALFDGVLGFMDIYEGNEFEIDKQLKLFYKS